MAPYTIPTIMLPSGQYVMDSLEIAKVLEKEYPTPPAHLDSPYYDRLLEQTKAAMAALPSVYVTNVYDRVLGEASRPYFHETRTKYLGMTIEEYLAKHPAEESFQAAEQYLRNVTGLLKENELGPFLMGREVCYADFVWGGFLLFFKVMGEDVWERFLKATGDAKVHLDFLEALEPWTKKVD
jgi:glutathione S-transferase